MGKKKRADLKATDMARKIWRTVGYCEAKDVGMCKNNYESTPSPQLQGAHIFGVGAYPRLKDDLRNGMSLCASCHSFWTSSPLDFKDFFKKTKYAKYEKVLRDKNNGPKVKIFWNERLEELNDIYKQIMAGELTVDEARLYEEN